MTAAGRAGRTEPGQAWGDALMVSFTLGRPRCLLGPGGTTWPFLSAGSSSLIRTASRSFQLPLGLRILIGCLNLGQNIFLTANEPRHSPGKVEREEE